MNPSLICSDPIQGCSEDSECADGEKCCLRGDCTRRCYAPAKPGRCPSSDPKPCSLILLTPECATDWDCSGDLKCCFDGCNKKCTSSFEKPRDGNLVFPCFLLHSSANLLPSFVLFCFFCFSCCGLFGCSLVRWFMVLFNRFCQFLVRSVVQRLSLRSLVGSDMVIKKKTNWLQLTKNLSFHLFRVFKDFVTA